MIYLKFYEKLLSWKQFWDSYLVLDKLIKVEWFLDFLFQLQLAVMLFEKNNNNFITNIIKEYHLYLWIGTKY